KGKLLHADGRAGMSPPFTIQGDQKIGGTVDDFWLVREILRTVHESQNLHDTPYFIEVAKSSLDGLKNIEHDVFRSLISLLDRQIFAKLPADVFDFAIFD